MRKWLIRMLLEFGVMRGSSLVSMRRDAWGDIPWRSGEIAIGRHLRDVLRLLMTTATLIKFMRGLIGWQSFWIRG